MRVNPDPSKHPPRCVLHRGQVATVHAWPGYQVKWESAGQCFRTSARLRVTTSNWKPCGFSKSWTETRFPPTAVWFRCDSARRLGTNLRSASSATSCPQERHSSSPEQPRANRTQAHHSATTHSAAGNFIRSIPRENNTSRHWQMKLRVTSASSLKLAHIECGIIKLLFKIEFKLHFLVPTAETEHKLLWSDTHCAITKWQRPLKAGSISVLNTYVTLNHKISYKGHV